MFCPRCNQNFPGGKFCSECGSPLEEEKEEPIVIVNDIPEPEPEPNLDPVSDIAVADIEANADIAVATLEAEAKVAAATNDAVISNIEDKIETLEVAIADAVEDEDVIEQISDETAKKVEEDAESLEEVQDVSPNQVHRFWRPARNG